MRGHGQVLRRSTEQTATAGWRRHRSVPKSIGSLYCTYGRGLGAFSGHEYLTATLVQVPHERYLRYVDDSSSGWRNQQGYKSPASRSSTRIGIAAQYGVHIRIARHCGWQIHLSLLSLWVPIADTSSPMHSPDRRRWCTASASYEDGAPASCHQQSFQLRPSA